MCVRTVRSGVVAVCRRRRRAQRWQRCRLTTARVCCARISFPGCAPSTALLRCKLSCPPCLLPPLLLPLLFCRARAWRCIASCRRASRFERRCWRAPSPRLLRLRFASSASSSAPSSPPPCARRRAASPSSSPVHLASLCCAC